MENIIYIYSLDDPITGEIKWIGATKNPVKRLYSHCHETKKRSPFKGEWVASLRLQKLKPLLTIIDEVPEIEWPFWEKHYIGLFKSWGFILFNMTWGGKGITMTPEIRKRLGDSKKAHHRKMTDETKFRLYISNQFYVVSDETRKKISMANKGKINSPEAIEKIALKLRGRKHTPEHIEKSRAGLKLLFEKRRLLGLKINTGGKIPQQIFGVNILKAHPTIMFNTIKEGADYFHVSRQCIDNQIHGKQHTACGYKWEYYNPISSINIVSIGSHRDQF